MDISRESAFVISVFLLVGIRSVPNLRGYASYEEAITGSSGVFTVFGLINSFDKYRSQFQKDLYKTGEVAKILGVTPQTVINYDKAGKLPIKRTSTNRRVIYKEDLFAYLDSVGLLEQENIDKVDVIYARVSSQDQNSMAIWTDKHYS